MVHIPSEPRWFLTTGSLGRRRRVLTQTSRRSERCDIIVIVAAAAGGFIHCGGVVVDKGCAALDNVLLLWGFLR